MPYSDRLSATGYIYMYAAMEPHAGALGMQQEIISDALPLGDADLFIEPLEDGRFLVSGNARLDDLSVAARRSQRR